MIIIGVEILDENWDSTISEVDTKLSQFEDFTSPTYQLKRLRSVDNKLILIKPRQAHFCEMLDFDWQELEIKNDLDIIQ